MMAATAAGVAELVPALCSSAAVVAASPAAMAELGIVLLPSSATTAADDYFNFLSSATIAALAA